MTGLAVPDALARNVGRFLADERGTTAIEYALVAGGVAVVVAAAIVNVGANVKTTLYDKLTSLF